MKSAAFGNMMTKSEFMWWKMSQNFLHFKISKTTAFISLFIIISASFMRQVLEFIQASIGKSGVTILLWLLITAGCITVLASYIIKKRVSVIKISALALLLITGLVLSWQMNGPIEEKVHILEYAVLGWLATKDLIRVNKKITGIVLACLFCVTVGISDEAFQAILPYRVFDIRDIVLNSLATLWGILIYLLSYLLPPLTKKNTNAIM